jgi:hypothetical protein
MNQLAVISQDLGDFQNNFFEPVNSNKLENLFIRHSETMSRMKKIHSELEEPYRLTALSFFINGNTDDRTHIPSIDRLFDLEGALKALHADYWQQAFMLTDVYDHMPAKRREEWRDLIKSKKTPEFEENSVTSTLFDLLNSRSKFFAERIDGIFRGLSGEHVTNTPEGFNKRMIFNGVMDPKWESTNSSKVWILNDFREVIARLLCREKAGWHSDKLVHAMYRNTGVWHDIDGGTFRAKMFKKGTLHLECHPDISWKLNQVLSILYPAAIPESFRRKPKKTNKTFDVIEDVLPVAVINGLSDYYVRDNGFTMQVSSLWNLDKVVRDMVENVIESIGGVRQASREFKFDYQFREVVDLITMTGRVPNQKSYQYYPTPKTVAEKAIEMAEIQDHHQCLEPSAGQGSLAQLMPKENTECIELSELNAEVLRTKGFKVEQTDFLEWADKTSLRFSRICLNPPYSLSRYKLHLEKAVSLLKNDGILVAILPATVNGKELIPGYSHEYSSVFENEFKGTSISTVIVKIQKSSGEVV